MTRAIVCFVTALVLAGSCAAFQPSEQSEITPELAAAIPALERRLAALDPEDPSTYFELGEEAAAEGGTPLATRLFALTLAMALESGDASLAAGACVALADLAESDRERRWMIAAARSLDDRYAAPDRHEAITPGLALAAERAASVFPLVRGGDGYEARRLLEEPEITRALARAAGPGWVDRLREQAQAWPCEECRNRRFIPTRDGPSGVRECPVCAANPGPVLGRAALLEHLAAEAALLGVEIRSWAALLATGAGEPLGDPDPGDITTRLGIDTGLRVWRDGDWTRQSGERP